MGWEDAPTLFHGAPSPGRGFEVTVFESIILGIVQGLTEFLPISSTAHLRVIPALLGWTDPGAAFSAVIQIGTILAVFVYFREDLLRIARGTLRGIKSGRPLQDKDGRLGFYICVGSIPIVVSGLLFQKLIKNELRSLYVIAAALVAVGIVMAIADRLAARKQRDGVIREITLQDALFVGTAQMFALIPGVSRSGSTIAAGLIRGLDRAEAARFSFLLSIPAITGAGLKELYELLQLGIDPDGVVTLITGTVVSFVVGYAAIAGLIAFLKKRSVMVFVVYRIGLAVVLLGLLGAGIVGHLG